MRQTGQLRFDGVGQPSRRPLRRARLFVLAFSVFLIIMPDLAGALTAISQGYASKEKIALGSIVSLEENSFDHVIASTTKNADGILGVAINDGSSLITFSSNQENQVQVATSGNVSVLVSDINGTIIKGDQITASPIKGVGMKATDNTKVVGIAQGEPMNDTGTQHYYTDGDGKKQPMTLGEVSVLINVSYYFKEPERTLVPTAIQHLANAIAGKNVSTLPIIISAIIFIITLIVVVSIIFSMIRSSIISVGRNPMSQSAVYRDVIQLSLLVLGILAVAVIAIYVILTRL